jgi:hypothetical protein
MRKKATILSKDFICSRLQGRTGNMMFQLAHSYAKALEYNRQFIAPFQDSSSGLLEKNLFRKLDFNIRKSEGLDDADFITGTFAYSDLPPSNNKPTVFVGWFQSEKYFGKYKEAIKDLYSPPKEFIEKALNDFPFLNNSVVAALNVRRGDYLTQPDRHPVVTVEYIEEAYKHLPSHDYIIVMSDDIAWCKENIKLPNMVIIENNNHRYWDQEGIWLLSLCDHFIISNSSFSWWGAWLSRTEDKVVIAPDTWFGPGLQEDTKDIYCDDWIKIPTRWDNGYIKLK